MPGTLLSTVSCWWARLFRRQPVVQSENPTPSPAENAGDSRISAKPAPGAAISEPLPPDTSGGVAAPDLAADAQSLRDTLGVAALPVAARPGHQRQSRERTLEALHNLRQIPALQSLAQSFLKTMNRPDVTIDEVVESIAKDSALCVRILRMANSVLVSPERRIEDLESAVHMLGVARVRKAAQALFTLRDAKRVADGFDWRHLWIHALATAAIAEELEGQMRSATNSQIHLPALLHDVGKIVLSTVAPELYRDVLVTAWNEGGRLEDLERDRLGVDHREAGVMFAQFNNMPEMAVQAIAHHANPDAAEEYRFEVALVSAANYISKAHGLGFSGARLDAVDGELEHLPAWDVAAQECGIRPDFNRFESDLKPFLSSLRDDLRSLREIA